MYMKRAERSWLWMVLSVCCVLASGTVLAENIGNVSTRTLSPRAKDVDSMLRSLLGKWEGDYEYFDASQRRYLALPSKLVFETLSLPAVISLDAISERGSGKPPLRALTTMVVRADGATIRQMVFQEGNALVADKIVTRYSLKSDSEWTMDILEAQEGSGGPALVTVEFVRSGDQLTITKRRSLEGDIQPPRTHESVARMKRSKT